MPLDWLWRLASCLLKYVLMTGDWATCRQQNSAGITTAKNNVVRTMARESAPVEKHGSWRILTVRSNKCNDKVRHMKVCLMCAHRTTGGRLQVVQLAWLVDVPNIENKTELGIRLPTVSNIYGALRLKALHYLCVTNTFTAFNRAGEMQPISSVSLARRIHRAASISQAPLLSLVHSFLPALRACVLTRFRLVVCDRWRFHAIVPQDF